MGLDERNVCRWCPRDSMSAEDAIRELIEAWGADEIFVTGSGSTRFLDAIHKCEEVADRIRQR